MSVEGQDEVAVVRFPETDQSGIYRMTIGASPREYLFAVNLPASTSAGLMSESDLQRADADELRAATSDGDVQIVTDLAEVKHRARAVAATDDPDAAPRSSAGPAVARVLLLVFLGLMILEMILAWRFGSARTVVPPDTAAAPPRPGLFSRLFHWSNIAFVPLLITGLLAVVLLHEARTDEFLGFLPSSMRSPLEALSRRVRGGARRRHPLAA